ncbi:DDB1- and CUL4-associated factor 8 [Armadillidium nasatum]|uniref:DDB1-and CUL4-associated factor 8 n=1 Tax=Armadillidium nasatum TaxID=96803 RepID=A0A5N5TLV8_9CRUS|nr:DDB1- and CUL4-associated factor 8 [Armadillidium nasatum]
MAEANSISDKEENVLDQNVNRNISPSAANEKKGSLVNLDNSESTLNISSSVSDESNRKTKRELPIDSLSSPNSTNKSKRHQRNYRTRIMDSSSDEESKNSHTNTLNTNEKNCEIASSSSNQNALSDNCSFEVKNISENKGSDNLKEFNSSVECKVNEREKTPNVLRTSQESNTGTSQVETSQSSTLPREESPVENSNTSGTATTGSRRTRRFRRNFPFDTDSDDSLDEDDDSEDLERRERNEEDKATQRKKLEENASKELSTIMGKRKPKHKWNSLLATVNRQYGMPSNRQSSILFTHRYYDSLHVAQRLELVSQLDYHTGCTNALNFSDSGDLLASSSDDLQIAVWDWAKEKTCITYNSGHRNNVFQCKFLPLTGNTHIVSCARDGQVRLAEISSTGVCKDTRRLAKHSRSAHKLTVRLSTPYEIMSAGEDAFVYNIDIRTEQPDKIVLVKDIHGKRVPLYSIHQHPINDDQFCVSGQDEYVRIYDRRIISPLGPPVLKYCPNHLIDKKPKSTITCAVYSNNGDAILASYNDDDIYLFDTSLSEGAAPAHRYSGHRNSSTVKGVNFFSPNSRYVVSGSDCGNIFIWDRESEAIVNWMHGDENGVVNVLEPHPHLPVLATSGLDSDIKIWVPSSTEPPKLDNLKNTVRSNLLRRLRESNEDGQGLDTHMLMVLFQHLRRSTSSRGRTRSGSSQGPNLEEDLDELEVLESSDESSNEDNDSDDSEPSSRVQCTTH